MWQWMEHEGHGGKAQFPAVDEVLKWWKSQGWRECEEPTEPDLLHDETPPEVAPAPEAAPTGSGKATTKKAASD
jgi:hypothetical protein